MPKLTFRLYLNWINGQLLFWTDQESKFSWNAEVRDGQVADLLKDWVSAEFNIDFLVTVQVVDCQRRDLHYISDVK